MADANDPGVGIRRWDIAPGGIVASNDLGTTIVEAGASSDLKSFPYDVAVDQDKQIYVPQYRSNSGDPDFRVLRFPAYDESGTPETVADWKIGSGDNTMGGSFGIAVDPSATYVAVAFQGIFSPPFGPWQNSSVRVFYATNGGFVAAPAATLPPPHDYRDVAWDNAGNLYAIDTTNSLWVAFSPPGTNQATTVAVATISVPAQRIPPVLSEPSYAAGEFRCFLTGEPNVIYYIQSSTNLVDWVTLVRNNSLFTKRPITLTATNKLSFYRALAGPVSPAPPLLSAPSYAAGQFHFTLLGGTNFTYIIQASTDLLNWAPVATNTAPTSVRVIDLTAPNPRSFYRVLALP